MSCFFNFIKCCLILFFLTFAKSTLGSDVNSIYITISFKDCNICHHYVADIQGLNDFKVKIIFKSEDKDLVSEYKKEYLSRTSEIIVSDTFYSRFNSGNFSTFHCFINNKEILKAPLKAWPLYKDSLINRLKLESNSKIEYKGLSMPKEPTIVPTSSAIYVMDNNFLKVKYLVRSNPRGLKPLKLPTNIEKTWYTSLFNKYPEKKIIHDSIIASPKSPNVKNIEVTSIYAQGDTLFTLNTLTYYDKLEFRGHLVNKLNKALFLASFQNGRYLNSYFIDWPEHIKGLNFDEFSVCIWGSNLLMNVYVSDQSPVKPLFARFKLNTSTNTFEIAEVLNNQLPSLYINKKLFYNLVQPVYKPPYYMLLLSNNLYRFSQTDSIPIPILMKDSDVSNLHNLDEIKLGTRIISIELLNNVLSVLYLDGDTYNLAEFDVESRILKNTKIINELSSNEIIGFPVFDGPSGILYSTKNCNCIKRLSLSQY